MNKIKKIFHSKIRQLYFFIPPISASIFPILSFYKTNISDLSINFIQNLLTYSIIGAFAVTLVIFLLVRDKDKTSLISTILIFIFFSYGHLSGSLNNILFFQLSNGMVLGPDKLLLPVIFFLFLLISYKILIRKKPFIQIKTIINFSLLILIGFSIISIAKIEFDRRGTTDQNLSEQSNNISTSSNAPDIYYIILDGYAREDVLKDLYDYDNSEFISKLEKIGFYVADKSRSNYIHTYLSLPSSLNMRYLDELPEKYGKDPSGGTAARQLISQNEITKQLKSRDYKIINFASTWEGTDESFQADITYKEDGYFKILGKNVSLDETNIIFLQTTLFSPFIKEVWGDALRSKTLSTLQKLPTIPYLEGKKFVMAHIITPHPPYVFDSQGNPVPGAEFEMADEGIDKRPKYLDQLKFISGQIVPVVEKIIENSPTKPIIILQSDHGPASIFGKREEWLNNYSEEGVKERSSILYALYLPDQDYQQFYESVTPVNTFRIIFNKYFDKNYELLPDKSYYTSYEAIYDYKDITDIK